MRGTLQAAGLGFLVQLLLSCAGSPAWLEQERPGASGTAPDSRLWEAPREIQILSWNLGFGGLGEGAEFYPDGGRRFIPSSRREVLRNVRGIGDFVQRAGADVFLFQEAARPSAVNRRVDLLAELETRLPGRWRAWSPQVGIRWPRVSVGLAVFAPGPPRRVERLELPGEKRWQRFHLLVTRFPVPGGSGDLVLADVHLSAFDPQASLRRGQLEAIADFLRAESGRGSYVVLGGDWNLLLADTRFPYTTEERYFFWVHPLPAGFPPAGFRLAVDERVASVRTLERPYVRGANYTAVIDGFLVSSNLSVLSVRTVDLGFRFSDHQPVEVRLRLD
jgi:endonuclease/exonuclease/phosphatase family metal-dependent hydrolase